ncbi:MAG: YraN family protein [Desulfatibacillaceae bacterium]
MAQNPYTKGRKGEDIAVHTLVARGYKILERNWRGRAGEVDVIAKKGRTLVFVEVKARASSRYGNPKEAVHPEKQRRISMVALEYLKSTGHSKAGARFDVVAIRTDTQPPEVEVVENAFELAYR